MSYLLCVDIPTKNGHSFTSLKDSLALTFLEKGSWTTGIKRCEDTETKIDSMYFCKLLLSFSHCFTHRSKGTLQNL